jgi:hypothetical protein
VSHMWLVNDGDDEEFPPSLGSSGFTNVMTAALEAVMVQQELLRLRRHER